MKTGLLALILAGSAAAQLSDISATRIRSHVKFLSSDLLEGRGVGARGGDLATEYLGTQFALVGAKPAGDNGTYFQNLTLTSVEPIGAGQLTATTADGRAIPFRWLDDFVGLSYLQQGDSSFDADAIFVGHGITAPRRGRRGLVSCGVSLFGLKRRYVQYRSDDE